MYVRIFNGYIMVYYTLWSSHTGSTLKNCCMGSHQMKPRRAVSKNAANVHHEWHHVVCGWDFSWWFNGIYPLVNIQKPIEHGHLDLIYPLKMVIFIDSP